MSRKKGRRQFVFERVSDADLAREALGPRYRVYSTHDWKGKVRYVVARSPVEALGRAAHIFGVRVHVWGHAPSVQNVLAALWGMSPADRERTFARLREEANE